MKSPVLLLSLGLLLPAAFGATATPERVIESWQSSGPRLTLTALETAPVANGWLTVRAADGTTRATLQVRPEGAPWNVDGFRELALPVRNLGERPIRVMLRADDPRSHTLTDERFTRGICVLTLEPGAPAVWLRVPLEDRKAAGRKFIGMMGQPPDLVPGVVNETAVTSVSVVLLASGAAPRVIAVGPLVARGVPLHQTAANEGLPFIDAYGQYQHREWPGKTHTDADLAAQQKREADDLAAHARPAEWDRFGGWSKGPQLKATGFFRVEKIDGQWWMVDPEGRLFWSHGVVRVGTRVRVGSVYRGTPLLDREGYFELPPRDGPFGAFYDTEPQATRNYYVGKEGHAVYDYLEANLFRKYGTGWADAYGEVAQRRLASWALNTIANSSDPRICAQRRTPYTAVIYSVPLGRSEHTIAGAAQGAWVKFPDPYDPGLRAVIETTLRTDLKSVLNDPWCLGIFVDNEMRFGDECFLAEAALASPADQAAKVEFVAELKRRYGTIDKLNAAWATHHGDWAKLLEATTPPDRARPLARADLQAFSERILDRYFGLCREVIKADSPHHLYLGCRFMNLSAPFAMTVAARHCDIVSINRYVRTIEDLKLPEGSDRPIVIGEFSFGALDRGKLLANNVPVTDQTERAASYRRYVESALRNPAVVGTHWFQYYDQPTSGRFDGENMQHGLIDLCDTPYPETIAAIREVGARLYQTRRAAAVKPAP